MSTHMSTIPRATTTAPENTQRTLKIHGLSIVSFMLLPNLQMMGFHAVQIQDARKVPFTAHVSAQWVGRPREALASYVVHEWCPNVRVEPIKSPTLTLVSGEWAVDPLEEQLLMDSRQPFMSVLTTDDGIDIGPWVGSLDQPCSTCQMLHYQDTDPTWIRSIIVRQESDGPHNTSRAILEAVSLLTRALATFDSTDPLLPPGHVFHVLNQGQTLDDSILVHPKCPWHQGCATSPMGA